MRPDNRVLPHQKGMTGINILIRIYHGCTCLQLSDVEQTLLKFKILLDAYIYCRITGRDNTGDAAAI